MIIQKATDLDNENADASTLYKDTKQHIREVRQLMLLFGWRLKYVARHHDWTKLEYFDDFADDVFERKCEDDFKKREWYNTHTTLERHHLNATTPEDVNLWDVIEFMCDCICAGYSRQGWLNEELLELDDEVLQLAYKNTIRYLANEIEVEE